MQVGPYRVVSEVARGGMGVVYRAQDAAGQAVALKLLLAQRSGSPAARRRFQTEVRALARLRHPHVVPILGAGEHEGVPWLALEFVEGPTLEERLRRGPLPVAQAIQLTQELAQALTYVHGCGVVHRDLKPANVLLSGGRARLTDFGLAQDDDSSLSRITSSGVSQGTPGYWAPEQAEGKLVAIGPRTDVYGLGAVLYACLTGRPPVEARTLQEYLQAAGGRVRGPAKLRREVPGWLDALCRRCLEPEPQARPESADAVGRELLLAGGRISVAGGRPWGPLVVAGGVCALALGGVGFALWSAGEAGSGSGNSGDVAAVASPSEDPAPPVERAELDPALDGASLAELMAAAETAARGGRLEQARAIYLRALELDPRAVDAWALRGAVELNLKRYDEAEVSLACALKLDRDHVLSNFYWGVLLQRTGRSEDSLRVFGRVLELDPDDLQTHYARGESLRLLGRFEEALAEFDWVLARSPRHHKALFSRAECKSFLGRAREAIADLDRVLALAPGYVEAYSRRAECCAELGEHEQAVRDYDRVLAAEPDDPYAWHNRGVSRERLGRLAEALADYTRALELGLASADCFHNRARCLGQLGRHEEALLDFGRSLALDPAAGLVWANRGISLGKLGRHAEALADFTRATELEPRDAMHWRNRGRSLLLLERFEEAEGCLTRALDLRQTDPETLRERSLVRFKLERWRDALADLDRLIRLAPNDGAAWSNRGRCYAALGDPLSAFANFDRALELELPPEAAATVRRLRDQAQRSLREQAQRRAR